MSNARYCPNCRLANPPSARKCLCGSSLVFDWEAQEEANEKLLARRRVYSQLWSAGAAAAFVAILWAVYLFADRL